MSDSHNIRPLKFFVQGNYIKKQLILQGFRDKISVYQKRKDDFYL